MPTLQQHLEDLPPELYDIIYNLTFTPEASAYHISGSYKPPSTLQINRTIRQLVTKRYYHPKAVFSCTNHEHCVRWLTSLSDETLKLLHEVRCQPVSDFWARDRVDYFAKSQKIRVHCQLLQRGTVLGPSVLKFRGRNAVDEDREAWDSKP